MIGILFILFNLSLYYTLGGFYLYLAAEVSPLVWGLPILIAVSIIYMVLRAKVFPKIYGPNVKTATNPIVISLCALPIVFLMFNPTILQILHYLPAWALTAVILLTGRVNIKQDAFKAHLAFTIKFFFVLVFAIFGYERIISSFISVAAYLIIYLLTGMTLLRILRQDGKLSRRRSIVAMLIFLFTGVIFAGLNMQEIIFSGAGLIWEGFRWILIGLGMAMFFTVGFFFEVINFVRYTLFVIGDQEEMISPGIAGTGDELMVFAEDVTAHIPEWFSQAGITVLLIGLAILGLALANHFIKKVRKRRAKGNDGIIREEEHELTKSQYKNTRRHSIFRPSDPRQAIRWYYRKYMKEGISRGAEKPLISDTSERIGKKYSSFFSKNEPKELRKLYIAARYQDKIKIPKSTVTQAATLWKKM